MYIQISGAIDYFYTASPECLPSGPHFDFKYYTTFSSIVGALAAWLGVILFQAVMGDWKFQKVFWFTTLIRVTGAMFDILIAMRWNVAMGVSDRGVTFPFLPFPSFPFLPSPSFLSLPSFPFLPFPPLHSLTRMLRAPRLSIPSFPFLSFPFLPHFLSLLASPFFCPVAYMFGDAIIYSIVYQMNFMPAVVLTSKVCPKGIESTVYALLAGFQNLGQNVSQSIGVFLIKAMGVVSARKEEPNPTTSTSFSLSLSLFLSLSFSFSLSLSLFLSSPLNHPFSLPSLTPYAFLPLPFSCPSFLLCVAHPPNPTGFAFFPFFCISITSHSC